MTDRSRPVTDRAVLVMAKAPTPGASKTRLTPTLSPLRAAALAACFIQDAVALAATVEDAETVVAFAPVEAEDLFRRLTPDVDLVAQQGGSLGHRLSHVLATALDRGHRLVIAINSDSPTLPADRLGAAFAELDRPDIDVVLGPADDGGYYLIGWKQPHRRIVETVTMSTPNVLADTLAIADEDGLHVSLLDRWYDIDTPEDLERLRAEVAAGVPCGSHTRRFLASPPSTDQPSTDQPSRARSQ